MPGVISYRKHWVRGRAPIAAIMVLVEKGGDLRKLGKLFALDDPLQVHNVGAGRSGGPRPLASIEVKSAAQEQGDNKQKCGENSASGLDSPETIPSSLYPERWPSNGVLPFACTNSMHKGVMIPVDTRECSANGGIRCRAE